MTKAYNIKVYETFYLLTDHILRLKRLQYKATDETVTSHIYFSKESTHTFYSGIHSLSFPVGISGNNGIVKSILFSYFFISLLLHYFIYDIAAPQEYYFYNNFGLTRLYLWGITAVIGLLFLLTSLFL